MVPSSKPTAINIEHTDLYNPTFDAGPINMGYPRELRPGLIAHFEVTRPPRDAFEAIMRVVPFTTVGGKGTWKPGSEASSWRAPRGGQRYLVAQSHTLDTVAQAPSRGGEILRDMLKVVHQWAAVNGMRVSNHYMRLQLVNMYLGLHVDDDDTMLARGSIRIPIRQFHGTSGALWMKNVATNEVRPPLPPPPALLPCPSSSSFSQSRRDALSRGRTLPPQEWLAPLGPSLNIYSKEMLIKKSGFEHGGRRAQSAYIAFLLDFCGVERLRGLHQVTELVAPTCPPNAGAQAAALDARHCVPPPPAAGVDSGLAVTVTGPSSVSLVATMRCKKANEKGAKYTAALEAGWTEAVMLECGLFSSQQSLEGARGNATSGKGVGWGLVCMRVRRMWGRRPGP